MRAALRSGGRLVFGICRLGVRSEGPPEQRRIVVDWKNEARRHHACHSVVLVINGDSAADDAAVAMKCRLPELMAENYHSRPRLLFLARETAPQHRLRAQNRKEVPGNHTCRHVQWLIKSGDRHAIAVITGHATE